MDRAVREKFFNSTNSRKFQAVEGECNSSCVWWESREDRAFVCSSHYCVHWCGHLCKMRILTREHEVCRLTGMVLGNGEMIWQNPKSTNPFNRLTNSHVQTSINRPHAATVANSRCKHTSMNAVQKLFCGKYRSKIREKNIDKLVDSSKRALKSGVSFCKLQELTVLAALRLGRNLIPPSKSLNPSVDALAEVVSSYAVALGGPRTTKFSTALTAAIIARLATGFKVGGTTIVPKMAFVANNCPPDLMHPRLLNVPCRAVSTANRHLATVTTTKAGFAIPAMVFPTAKLNRLTPKQSGRP